MGQHSHGIPREELSVCPTGEPLVPSLPAQRHRTDPAWALWAPPSLELPAEDGDAEFCGVWEVFPQVGGLGVNPALAVQGGSWVTLLWLWGEFSFPLLRAADETPPVLPTILFNP